MLAQLSQTALEEASIFSQAKVVREAYRTAHTGNINDELSAESQAARDLLRQELKPYIDGYKAQSGRDEFKLHFHLPNGRSLVRLWRDGWQTKRNGQKLDVSDDISPFRHTIVTINAKQSNHEAIKGIEVGRGGFAIRGISPVTDEDGTHLGSCEVLVPFNPLIDKLNQSDDRFTYSVFMQESLRTIATQLQDPVQYPSFNGEYVLCATTGIDPLSNPLLLDWLDAGRAEPVYDRYENNRVMAFPIRDYSDEAIGVFFVDMDASAELGAMRDQLVTASKSMHAMLWLIVVGCVLTVCSLSGVTIFVCTVLAVRPINELTDRIFDIAEGEGDLSKHIDIKTNDELGKLGTAFNTFANKVRIIILAVTDAIRQVHDFSQEIETNSKELSAILDNQTGQFSEMSTAVEQLSNSISDVSSQSSIASSKAQEAGAIADEGGNIVQQAVESMQSINEAVVTGTRSVQELSQRSEQIGEVVDVINEIADQTNLLALNAAIEAARAGEHGRGFAVVADEVRKLAERTTQATTEVADSISAIQAETSLAVEQMEGGMAKVEGGVNLVNQAGESLKTIVNETNEVVQTIEGINEAIMHQSEISTVISKDVESVAEAVRTSTDQVVGNSETMCKLSEKVEAIGSVIKRFNLKAPDRRKRDAPLDPGQMDKRQQLI